MMMKTGEVIFLDHAAATPLDDRVLAVMVPYFSDKFYNPSSSYVPALNVRRDYLAAKARLAVCIGAKADELVMTAGATESINLAIRGIGGHVLTSAIEHEAVLAVARAHDHSIVSTDKYGRIDTMRVRGAIRPNTRVISIGLANSELGTLQPISDIADVVRQERVLRRESGNKEPLYLHCDASQGVGLVDVHVSRLGVDLLTINASKIYGPKQVGLLWMGRSVQLEPSIVGGGQERGLRSGTENVAGAVGFAYAMELSEMHRKSETIRLERLRDYLQARLTTAIPKAIVSGDMHRRLASHLHIAFPGIDGERLVFGLEARGVLVATGSACAANKGKRSHVLSAIGLSPEVADGSLRISLGRLSNQDAVSKAASLIIEEVKKEYGRVRG